MFATTGANQTPLHPPAHQWVGHFSATSFLAPEVMFFRWEPPRSAGEGRFGAPEKAAQIIRAL